jgi:hypothetical protein
VYVVLIEPGMFKTDIMTRNRKMAARSSDPASPYKDQNAIIPKAMDDLLAKAKSDPMTVARVIVKTATVAKPKLRWPVGRDASMSLFFRSALPAGMFEAAVLNHLKKAGGLDKNG